MELPFRIPDSFLPVLLGLGLWFGACYIYFAPELTERAIAMHVANECATGVNPNICSCVLTDIQTGTGAFNNAVFLSTFGLSEPRVRIWNNDQNPYIQYTSLAMNDQSRRKTCDAPRLNPVAKAIEQAEISAKKQVAIEMEKALAMKQKQFEDAMEKQRQAQQQIINETKKQITEVADAAKNSPIVKAAKKAAKEQTEQAIRVYKLKDQTANEALEWWEYALKKSEKRRHELAQRYGTRR